MTNIAMEAMAHRNRWFTYYNMVIFHGELLNNQMVYITVSWYFGGYMIMTIHDSCF